MLRVMPETRGRGTGSTALTPEDGAKCARCPLVESRKLESRVRGNVQALVREGAERNVLKGNALAAYFTAIDATSRVWMAGVVSIHRDRELADRLLHQVRACCQGVRVLLVCTDRLNA